MSLCTLELLGLVQLEFSTHRQNSPAFQVTFWALVEYSSVRVLLAGGGGGPPRGQAVERELRARRGGDS